MSLTEEEEQFALKKMAQTIAEFKAIFDFDGCFVFMTKGTKIYSDREGSARCLLSLIVQSIKDLFKLLQGEGQTHDQVYTLLIKTIVEAVNYGK